MICVRTDVWLYVYIYIYIFIIYNMFFVSRWIRDALLAGFLGQPNPWNWGGGGSHLASWCPGHIQGLESLLFEVLGCFNSVTTNTNMKTRLKQCRVSDMLTCEYWYPTLENPEDSDRFCWFRSGLCTLRCTPVLFSWPSDCDPLVQAFGGSC